MSVLRVLGRYDTSRIKGSASSYTGQGICSVCHERPAKFLTHWTKSTRRAYCKECAVRLGYDVKVWMDDESSKPCRECIKENVAAHSFVAREDGLCFMHARRKKC